MNYKQLFIIFVGAAVLLEAAADILFKKWGLESRNHYLLIGLIIYFIGTLFWAYSMKYEYLSKAIPVFTICNLVIITFAGTYFFKDVIAPINIVGIVLGIASVVLIEL